MRKGKRAVWIGLILLLLVLSPMQTMAEGGITIDTAKKYEGMDASFSKGYEPTIEGNTMYLVIPFIAEKEIQNNRITVGVEFEKEENSPFYFQNYKKKVKRTEDGIYLYQCKIKLKEERISGQYPLTLSVQAKDSQGTLNQKFTIYVEITSDKKEVEENQIEDIPEQQMIPEEPVVPEISNSLEQEPEKSHQPRVMVDSNSLQGGSVEAGSSNTWNITAKNCSSKQSIENIKVTLLCENKDVSFEKNAWYFEKIGTGGKMDLSQNISVGKKAPAEPVSVQLQFEYEDSKGNSYTSAETVNISINQPQQADIINLSFPESVYASDSSSLTFQIQNTGLAVIYNAKVRLEGKGLFPDKELFIGNVEAGAAIDGEIPVFAGTLDMDEVSEKEGNKYGETSGTVIFSYENEKGETIEQKKEINTQIKKPQMVELKVEKDKPQTNQWWITIVFGIIVVLILIVIWLYLRMKHFKKRVEFHEKP